MNQADRFALALQTAAYSGVKGWGLVGFLRGFSKRLAVFLSGLVAGVNPVVFQYCAWHCGAIRRINQYHGWNGVLVPIAIGLAGTSCLGVGYLNLVQGIYYRGALL